MEEIQGTRKRWLRPVIYKLSNEGIQSGGNAGSYESVKFTANTCGNPLTVVGGATMVTITPNICPGCAPRPYIVHIDGQGNINSTAGVCS